MQSEFSTLADDANIYKLVGPVLLKQDTAEAKSTVDGRLEYIGQEMYDRLPLNIFNTKGDTGNGSLLTMVQQAY